MILILIILKNMIFLEDNKMKTFVDIIESEAGWGQKIDETISFDSREEADLFCREYNEKYNNQDKVPSWYMFAKVK